MRKIYAKSKNSFLILKHICFLIIILFATFQAKSQPGGLWQYTRPITLTTATTLANYQVKVTLVAGQYGNMNANGSDLRFYDAGNNLCPHWIETFNTAGTSVIWVKVVTAGSTLTMYYGNPSAPAVSDGNATFDFFDDFDSPLSANWNTVISTGSITQSGTNETLLLTNTGSVSLSSAFTPASPSFFIETKHKEAAYNRNRFYATTSLHGGSPTGFDYGLFKIGTDKVYWNGLTSASNLSTNTNYLTQWKITDGSTYNWYNYLYSTGAPIDIARSTSVAANIRYITFSVTEVANTSTIVDWVRVRKSQSTDVTGTAGTQLALTPTLTTLGSSSGCSGTNIVINGTNLGGATAANTKIGGTAVTSIVSNTGTQIIAVIGNGTTGNVVVVANGKTSNGLPFMVNFPPSITTQPAATQTICLGASASFTVAVTGTPTPTFQWRKNGTNIGGATSATYSIASVTAGDAATYSVVVTNSCSAVTSSNAVLLTASTGSWIGVTSTNWFTASNWCGGVPTAASDITIPTVGSVPFQPVIGGAGAVCRDIILNGTLSTTTTNNLDVYGDWTNNGTFTNNTGSVSFRGSTGNTLAGSSTTTFYNLVVNKTAAANTLTSTGLAFTATNVTLTQGNLILQATNANYTVSNNITVPVNGILTHSVNWNVTGRLLSVGGNIAVDGIFNFTTRSHVQMTGSVKTVYTGTNPASAFSILTLTATGNIAAAGTLTVNDNFWAMFGSTGSFSTGNNTVTANAGLLMNNGTVNLNGGTLNVTGGITVGNGNPATFNFTSGTLNADGLTVGVGANRGLFNQAGGIANIFNLTITNTATASLYTCTGSPVINITGTWTNDETAANSFAAATSQVNFIGGGAQTIGGGAVTTFNNLNINNASGIDLGQSANVNGTLNLANGLVTTGANVMTMAAAGNITNASAARYINGKLAWVFNNGASSRVYHTGKGGNYRPITFAYSGISNGPSTVTAEQFETALAGALPGNETLFPARHWVISQIGGTNLNYKVTLDPTGYTPVGTFVKILKKEGNGAITAHDATTPNYTNVTGFTTFNGTNDGTNSFALAHDCSSSANAGAGLADICQYGTTAPLGGSISGTATGGIWSSSVPGGTFTPSATNLNATWTPPAAYFGTATLTLTPTGGLCTPSTPASKTQKVIEGPTGNFTATETSGVASNDNIICIGSTVIFTAPSGYGSYIFKSGATVLQTGGANVYSASTLPLGVSSITVDVANALNCGTTFGPIAITVNDLPTPTLSADKAAICPGDAITFTASPAPAAGYIYNFKVGGSSVQTGASNIYSPLAYAGGAVTVYFTNANGCIGTSAALTVTVNPLPVGTLATTETSGTANDNKVCIGDNVTFTATAGAGNTYDFKINGVSAYTASNIFVTSFATAGSPIITVEVTNSNGCKATFGPTQVITVYDPPTGTLTATENSGTPNNNEICSGSPVTFTATAGVGNNYKFYLKGTGAPLYNGTLNTYSTSSLADGDYFTVTVTNGNGCAAVYTSPVITVVAAPSGTLSAPTNPTTTICVGGSIDFVATAGYSNYNFKVGATSFQNGPSNIASRTGFANGDVVTVEVSNSATCSAIFNSLTITVNSLPAGSLTVGETSGNANNDGIICTGAPVVFTATAGFTLYNFKLNGTTVQYNSSNTYGPITTLANGDVVSVEVSNASNCVATFNELTITVHPYDVVAPILGDADVCVGKTITLTNATISGTWSSTQPLIASIDNAGIVTGVSVGVATISYTVVNANGCSTIVTKDITVNALPAGTLVRTENSGIAPNDGIICTGAPVTFTAPTGFTTYDFRIEGVTIQNTSSNIFITSALIDGDDVTVEVTNSAGCKLILNSFTITVHPYPSLSVIGGPDGVCKSSTITLSNTVTGNGGTWTWSSNNTTVATINANSGLVTGLTAGTTDITYLYTNANGCPSSITKTITVFALPVATITGGSNPICQGSLGVMYTTQAFMTNYVWTVINGVVTAGGTSSDNTITIDWTIVGTKTLTVNYTDVNGCTAATAGGLISTAVVTVPALSGPAIVCVGDIGKVYTTDAGMTDYVWIVNGGTITSGGTATSSTATVTWNTTGTRNITVNYSDVNGCSAINPTSFDVTVNPLPTATITGSASSACLNTNPPTITFTGTGATIPYTFTYNINGGSSLTIISNAAGVATLTAPTATAGTFIYNLVSVQDGSTTTCSQNQSGSATVTVRPLSTATIAGTTAVCQGATAPTITFTGANSTAPYTFTYNINGGTNLTIMSDALGVATLAVPTVTAGTFAYNLVMVSDGTSDACPNNQTGVATVIVNPLPTATITGTVAVCQNATSPNITFTGSNGTAPYTFTYKINGGADQTAVSVGNIAIVPATATVAGTFIYTMVGVTDASGTVCSQTQTGSATVTVNPLPTIFNVTGGGAYCSGGTGVIIGLSGSESGVNYQLYNGATAVGAALGGTGSAISFGNQTASGTYTVIATVTATSCIINMNGNAIVTINPLPIIFSVTGGGAYCSGGAGVAIGLSGSQSGVNYQLYIGAITVGSPVSGTGSAISFGNQTTAGTYTVVAADGTTTCSNNMTGSVTVTINSLPTVTAGPSVCVGSSITLSPTTGGTWMSSNTLFATVTNAGVVTGVAPGSVTFTFTQTSTGCSNTTSSVNVSAPPTAPNVTPTSTTICAGTVVPLSAGSGSSNGSPTFSSGTVNIPIPDFSSVGAASTIAVSGIPSGAVINSVSINFNIDHTWDGDLKAHLKAPNGNVLCIVNREGGSGDNFTNTTVNSISGNSIVGKSAPFNGTYAPEAGINVGGATIVTGNVSNASNYSQLFSAPNGNWIFSARDDYNNDNGTILNWSITINWTLNSTPQSVVWSPLTGLYTDAGATTAYTGTPVSTVYAKPLTSGANIYTATITDGNGCSSSSNTTINVNPVPVITLSSDYCIVPGKVRLTAMSNPAASSFLWSTGQSGSSIDVDIAGDYDVVATLSTGCYSIATISVANELVVNGDFEAGNTAFTSDYNYKPDLPGLQPPGQGELYNDQGKNGYSITPNGQNVHIGFWGLDHTNNATGSRNFMAVNGHLTDTYNNLDTLVVWKQTVNVLPNTQYYFSAWAMSLNAAGPFAQLKFSVNGAFVGTAPVLPSGVNNNNNGYTGTARWTRFYGTWTSGPSTTSAVIYINNLEPSQGGNDFGLDDISFGTLSTFIDLISATGTDAQTVCVNDPLTDIVYRAGNGDITGPNVTGLPTGVIKTYVGDKLTISGTPTVPGTYTYTITTTGCAPYAVTGTITVQTQTMTLSAGSSSPTLCINSLMPAIEYTVGGSGTGAALSSGAWPAGVSGGFTAGKFTITGTPTVAGVYPYSITTTGTCKDSTLSGTITVQQQEIVLTTGSATQTVCIDADIEAIVYTVTGTGTGAGVTGLPPGVSGAYSGGVFVISGKPISPAAGTYGYTVTTTGTCSPAATISGSITVNPAATITLLSAVGTDGQSICINDLMTTPITYTIGGGGTNATVSGLPTGVTGSFSAGTLTISGTPSVAGIFIYTITTTGTCAQATKTGTITVDAQTIALSSGNASPTVCIGSPWTDIVFTIGGTATGATLTGTLPAGVTGSLSDNIYTISGTPTALGSFNYTITTSGTCATASVSGTIVVNTGSIGGTLPAMVAICSGASGTLNLTGHTGIVVRWESSTDYGVTWTNISNTTTTLPFTNITVPTQYRALVKSGSCNAIYSSEALVAIRNYWTGMSGTDWQIAGNWSDNQVPSMTCPDVYIPNMTNDPTLSTGSSTIGNIFINSGAILTVNGTGLLQIAGNINNNGSFDVSAGQIEMNGTAAQTIALTTFDNHAIKDLKITNSIGVTLTGLLDVFGSVTYGGSNGKFFTNGNLTLKSDVNNTAWLGDMTGGHSITGNVTVERFINTGTGPFQLGNSHRKSWQLLAVPTDGGQTINQAWQDTATYANEPRYPGYGTMITSNVANALLKGFDQYTVPGPTIKVYNSTTNAYDGPPTTNATPIYNIKGYLVLVRGDRSVTLFNQDANKTVLRSKGRLFTPANLPPSVTVPASLFESVGNPYASAIDLRKLSRSGGLIDAFIVWDPRTAGAYGLGGFTTLTKQFPLLPNSDYISTPGSPSYPAGQPHNFIQSGQAFFIQADMSSGTIGFTEGAKAGAAGVKPTLLRQNLLEETIAQLRTNLYSVNADGSTAISDGTLIQYHSDFSNDIDKLDARKLTNTSENLGIRSGGKDISVERRAPIVETDTIFYKLTTVRVQHYRYEYIAEDLDAFGVIGFIEDNYLGTKTPLNLNGTTTVDFNVVNIPGSYAADRFRIVFKQVVVVPVTFIDVQAGRNADRSVAVQWKVANEVNIQKYEVERSADGRSFTGILTRAPLTNNGSTGSYTDIDLSPLSTDNFYRIKAISIGGQVQYSSIVKVGGSIKTPASWSVFPNPVKDRELNLKISNAASGNYKLVLLSVNGQEMFQSTLKISGNLQQQKIKLPNHVGAGQYQLLISGGDGFSTVEQITIL